MDAKGQALKIPDIDEMHPRQRRWALNHGIKLVDRRYTQTVGENLFQPLTAATQADYTSNGGIELSSSKGYGNLQFLYSSSALVCNVFDYWRNLLLLGQPLDLLITGLGAPGPVKQIQFGQSYKTGLGGFTPYIDVVLRGDEPKPFLIKSQFIENRGSHYPTKLYYSNSGELWGKYGLPRCEALARRINADQEEFLWLNAPRLLNYILGLVDKFGKDFTFLYLWYDHTFYGEARLRAEIETFILRLNGEIDFRAMTYQELFRKMQGNPAIDKNYIAYLKERYFPG